MTSSNNELGGREYSEELQQVIYTLSLALKNRDKNHNTSQGLTPSQYMKFYTKAAGLIVELAIQLTQLSPGGGEVKNFFSWIKTLTGLDLILTLDGSALRKLFKGSSNEPKKIQ